MHLHPVFQALLAGLFTWALTAGGAAMVFFFRQINLKVLNGMLGFAGGVMIAASVWSLLIPAIDMTEAAGGVPWVPAVIGFLGGGAFLWALDRVTPHLHLSGHHGGEPEGIPTHWKRSVLLVLAITLHNIPEGLAVGVAFGAVAADLPSASIGGAVALAMGIGLQNFPEGAAVSIPLRREGLSRMRAFTYGQLSGLVEPISAVVGAAAVMLVRPILPYTLAFAAGAMIYVVVEELIPESQDEQEGDFATVGAMMGFATMMVMDVALG